MSCTLLLLGMYVADCAACRSHTHAQGGQGGVCVSLYVYVPKIYVSSFQQSPPNPTNTVSLLLLLPVCLSVCLL